MLTTLKALSDATRLRLVGVLSRGEFTVQELTTILGMGQSRISRHLKILLEAGILSVKRQGTWGYYRLAGGNSLLGEIWPSLESRQGNLEGHLQDLEGLSRVLEERRRKSRVFFDRHARQWDELTSRILALPPYRRDLLDSIRPCRALLEAGVGTGALLGGLCEKAPLVVAVDHSAAMLEKARERADEECLEGVDFRLGELSHLPLSDGEVEVALLNMVLHHSPRPAVVFKELSRVLSPTGVLVIADLRRHDMEWVRERLADQWLGFERSELEGWLAAGGFQVERYRDIDSPGGQGVFLLSARKDGPV